MNNQKFPITFLNKARYSIPNRWDLLSLVALFGLLGWLAWGGAQMIMPYELGEPLPISLNPSNLPMYAWLSVLRMAVALVFSFVFTLIIGSLAAKRPHAAKLIIPLIDVLQSVPVLGFLALTVTSFIRLFPGSRLGPECAAIFAIFTAQVWNMILNFYQSLRAVPTELTEATTLFQLSAWQRFWRLEVPFALPGLIWNMMLSMSGSWVFLVASEAISVGNYNIHLPGVGSYLGLAIQMGSLKGIGWTIGTMFIVILIYDQLFFRPLLIWSHKFNAEETMTEVTSRSWVTTLLKRTHVLKQLHVLTRYSNEWFLNNALIKRLFPSIPRSQLGIPLPFKHSYVKIAVSLISLYVVSQFLYDKIQYIAWQDSLLTLGLGGLTALRVFLIVSLSSLFWVPVGVYIGLRPHLTAIVQPMAQFLAAFPSNILFPLLAFLLLTFNMPLELGVLIPMLLTSQWYILFNVIAGVNAIPKELYQITQNLGVTKWLWWKRLILPGLFPHLTTGIMTAVGTAWNISVMAEVIRWESTTLKVFGLGAYIDQASMHGNFPQIAIGIGAMSLWVLTMNYFIWQPLYHLAQSKYRLN